MMKIKVICSIIYLDINTMSKIKDLFLEIREREEEQNEIEKISVFNSGIMCPNCFKSNLMEYSAEDLYCESCGYDFIRINKNQIRFK